MRHARLAAWFLALASAPLWSAPRMPADDSVVLETLRVRPGDPAAAELRRLRAAVAAAPNDPGPAVRLARRYFDLAMEEGDPRYAGYAQAALRAWPENSQAGPEILVLHGMLRQYRHDFDAAMANFERALKAEPSNFGARAWRVAILMVRADYAGARRECALLAPHASALQSAACTTYIDATTGDARGAYARLSAALARAGGVDPEYELWLRTRLAEMAWRGGDPDAAERQFRAALGLGINDNFLLAAYADFLLERGRAAEVMKLLRGWERSDTLLLRLGLAARALGLPEADKHARTLGDRFADAAQRGEKLHLQEEARFLLELKGDAPAALRAAQANYRSQREPRDALILIEAPPRPPCSGSRQAASRASACAPSPNA